MPLRFKAPLALLVALGLLVSGAGLAAADTLLRLNGIGPLRLGMTRSAALATGWLTHRTSGCPLGGPPLPTVYRVTGRRAPRGLSGTAEFDGGKLRVLSFTRGVHTRVGVTVGRTTVSAMVHRYRAAGFRARAQYIATFQGTFVTVRRTDRGPQLLGAFASRNVVEMLAVPDVPVCE